MLHGWKKWKDSNDDIFGARPRGISIWRRVASPIGDFFCENFFMNSLTDELLGITHPKFDVGDLVSAKASSDADGTPWLGIVTSVTILKNKEQEVRNVYTVEWIDREATEILWYDWYDSDLMLIQPGASC